MGLMKDFVWSCIKISSSSISLSLVFLTSSSLALELWNTRRTCPDPKDGDFAFISAVYSSGGKDRGDIWGPDWKTSPYDPTSYRQWIFPVKAETLSQINMKKSLYPLITKSYKTDPRIECSAFNSRGYDSYDIHYSCKENKTGKRFTLRGRGPAYYTLGNDGNLVEFYSKEMYSSTMGKSVVKARGLVVCDKKNPRRVVWELMKMYIRDQYGNKVILPYLALYEHSYYDVKLLGPSKTNIPSF